MTSPLSPASTAASVGRVIAAGMSPLNPPPRSPDRPDRRFLGRVVGRFAVLWLLGALLVPARGADNEEEEVPQWSFVVGRYDLIGRHPDRQQTYTGTARIDRVGTRLRLSRRIAGKHSEIFGVVRRADPGEAYVLSFKWGRRTPMEMVCVIGADLDNYARLTCHWGKAGNPHRHPGMEAYFAQEPWDPA